MRCAYIGNFSAPHSTENHVARALENNGHDVVRLQEAPRAWREMHLRVRSAEPDFVLWTTTHDYAPPETFPDQREFLRRCQVPVVGYHLDLWWGLDREHRIHESPFFTIDLVCTADGGHDDQWEKAGVNHAWFQPGVSRDECEPGTFREEYAHDLVFVGSWQGGYHAESHHRHELVAWLQQRGCVFYPRPGEPALRGQSLRDLYASCKVVVGDSCNVPRLYRYWSDRVPECTGRGGFLLHPKIVGLGVAHPDLVTWTAGDWDQLGDLIDCFTADDATRQRIAATNREHTLAHHTYERRMEQLADVLSYCGLLVAV